MYYRIQVQNKVCARHAIKHVIKHTIGHAIQHAIGHTIKHAIQHATTDPHLRNADSSIIRPDHYDISRPYIFDDIHVDFAGNKNFCPPNNTLTHNYLQTA